MFLYLVISFETKYGINNIHFVSIRKLNNVTKKQNKEKLHRVYPVNHVLFANQICKAHTLKKKKRTPHDQLGFKQQLLGNWTLF